MMSQLFRLTGEAKVESVCDYLDYLLEVENRFIVFAHHKVVLDPLERKLREKKVTTGSAIACRCIHLPIHHLGP